MNTPDLTPTPSFTGLRGAVLRYDVVGGGLPVVALHGAYSTRHEIRSMLEPVLAPLNAHRRLYPDLPAMGDSPPHDSIRTSQAIVELLDELIEVEIGGAPFLVVGHSYGGHLARGLAARRMNQLAGLALICPLMPETMNREPHRVVTSTGAPNEWLDADLVDEYAAYFVVHTPATAERFRIAVAPTIGRFDAERVGEMLSAWRLDPDPDATQPDQPVLIVTGRHDSLVGYRDQLDLLDLYPAATFVTVANAGHAVAHEQPDVVAALIADWAARCALPGSGGLAETG